MTSFASRLSWLAIVVLGFASVPESRGLHAVEFRGRVIDADTGEPIPARVYVRSGNGEFHFVSSTSEEGTAVPYREQWIPMPTSIERHTTISAHPFRIELPRGTYQLEVARGKEYLPFRAEIRIEDQPVEKVIELRRWINTADRGWYSGETHVHRRIQELPNVMLAEDLNVAFPVTFWTVSADSAPDLSPSTLRRQGPSPFGPRVDRGYEPIKVDDQHVIFPRNTEYEIFNVGGQRHVLGAIFVLNHRSVFQQTAPPVTPIARRAHEEGALLDLDKHSWPWSMMLVPVAGIDLFELSNNSVWRTQFGFKSAPQNPPTWTDLETEGPNQLTEWGWLNYGFEIYYALLNCGFRIAPSAGTASGVHPVPLGYSRVYVHTGNPFDADEWLAGLKQGRSFVTTGPMLFATVNGTLPGEEIQLQNDQSHTVTIELESISERPIDHVEILVNGKIAARIEADAEPTPAGAWRLTASESVSIDRTSWIAVRSTESRPDGRKRFAHTAPWHLTVNDEPITPMKAQVQYFIGLIREQIDRNRNVLSTEALHEFTEALRVYEDLEARAE